ncbi:MAG: MXAN_5187 C-terminal domain-containing protein [Myxococcota bacterium]
MELREFELLLKETERKLDRLKALYEQYFQGIERLEPTIARKDLARRMATLRKNQPRQTALRFRFQSLTQRHSTFQQYWSRTCRQIEEGTYRRHVLRARRRFGTSASSREAERQGVGPRAYDVELPGKGTEPKDGVESVRDVGAEVEAALRAVQDYEPPSKESSGDPRQVRSSKSAPHDRSGDAPIVATFTKPAEPARATVSEQRLQEIYTEYVEARRGNHERVDNLKFDKVARSIRSMVPKLEEKYRGKKIDFRVVVKGGRVGIKPIAED